MGRPPVIVAGNASAFGPEPSAAKDEPDELLAEHESDDAPPGSVLAGLRAAAELQRQTRHLELPIGGHFGDKLRVRYRVLPQREWDKYSVLLQPNPATGETDLPPMSVLNARMMAAACETVLWYEGGEQTDLEVGLDGGLAELLGYPLPDGMSYDDLSVLEVVGALFASPMAITSHAGQLVTWMQNPTEAVEPGEA